jgi:hypothetical protein
VTAIPIIINGSQDRVRQDEKVLLTNDASNMDVYITIDKKYPKDLSEAKGLNPKDSRIAFFDTKTKKWELLAMQNSINYQTKEIVV